MKKKECPSCAMEIDDNSKICPICNYEFPQTKPTIRITAIILIIIMILFLVFRLI